MKLENNLKFNSKNQADIQAYLDYVNIVGTDDNGKLMSEKEYENYKKNISEKRKNRLYVFWINSDGFECKAIGPESMCFCNHRYKYHDFDNAKNKKIKCKKCNCKCYEHVPCYGANDVKCLCHHSYREHDLISRKCNRKNCKCKIFGSKFTCNCGEGYDTHKTVIYTKEERIKMGKPVETGWYGESLMGGGLQNFGQMMNDIYDTEFKNLEKAPTGKKIMYKNGVAVNNKNYNNDLENEYNNYDNNKYSNNKYDNNKYDNMSYEEIFGIKKSNSNNFRNDVNSNYNNVNYNNGNCTNNRNLNYNGDSFNNKNYYQKYEANYINNNKYENKNNCLENNNLDRNKDRLKRLNEKMNGRFSPLQNVMKLDMISNSHYSSYSNRPKSLSNNNFCKNDYNSNSYSNQYIINNNTQNIGYSSNNTNQYPNMNYI